MVGKATFANGDIIPYYDVDSFLDCIREPEEQRQFLDAMEYSQNTPSLSQAQRLKKLSREGKCTQDAMYKVMSEEKKDELDRVTLKSDTLRKYFPKNYTPQQMEQVIIKLLDQWQKKRQRQNER